jgi:parallel beta-helix repeat protein
MTRKVFLGLIASGIVCLALAGVSSATVPRAFVSINGSDLNPCSATQPCRSFNQALTVVEPGGEIIVQNSGGYSTGFMITQSVTIDAAGFNASVISTSATDLCVINAGPADRVVLRGISFHGAGVGQNAINATQVASLYVEHCSISEFTGDGVSMLNGGGVWVTGTDVRKCNRGLHVGSSSDLGATLVALDSRFTECFAAGVFVVASSIGDATGWLSNCTASLCGDGFAGASTNITGSNTVNLTLTNCRAFGNDFGLALGTSAGNTVMLIVNCVVTGNNTGIVADSLGAGTASVIGTNPGTSLISGNGSNNATTGSTNLQ